MIFSSYVANIASWIYQNTTSSTSTLLITDNYLSSFNNINWINSFVTHTYVYESTFFNGFVYIILCVVLVLLISSIFTNNNTNTNTLNTSITFLQLIEDELSSGTKLIFVYITLFGYIIWFFLYSYLGFTLPWILGILPLYGALLIFLLFGIPLMLLLNYRAFFMTYIRGNVGLKPLLMELVLDYINLIAFFLRFNIQLIRILIITAIFFLYNELFEELIYPMYGHFNYININLTTLILFFANLLYEVGHFWIIFGMQSSATLFILTILFQFLYTQVFFNKFQFFFNIKRINR